MPFAWCRISCHMVESCLRSCSYMCRSTASARSTQRSAYLSTQPHDNVVQNMRICGTNTKANYSTGTSFEPFKPTNTGLRLQRTVELRAGQQQVDLPTENSARSVREPFSASCIQEHLAESSDLTSPSKKRRRASIASSATAQKVIRSEEHCVVSDA
jgi:hypothetical protein